MQLLGLFFGAGASPGELWFLCERERESEGQRERERGGGGEAGQVRRTSRNRSLHNNTQSNTYTVTQCGIQGDTVTVM